MDDSDFKAFDNLLMEHGCQCRICERADQILLELKRAKCFKSGHPGPFPGPDPQRCRRCLEMLNG